MSDICKCPNEACPEKSRCYRYTVEPHPYWQSYSDFRPNPDDGICLDFMPIYHPKTRNDDEQSL